MFASVHFVRDIKTYPYKLMMLKKALANVTLVTILDCLLEGVSLVMNVAQFSLMCLLIGHLNTS